MNKVTVLPMLIGLFLCSFALSSNAQTELKPNGLAGKKLFLDFYTPNQSLASDGESFGLTDGFELTYQRYVSRWLNVAFPLKVGVIKIPGDLNRSWMLGFDGVVQIHPLQDRRKFSPYGLVGVGGSSEQFEDTFIQLPVGIGANIKLWQGTFLNLQSEYRQSFQDNRSNFHHGIGLLIMWGQDEIPSEITDTDKDGVIDVEDQCPETPGLADLYGCPDTDLDGIADIEDLCPEIPGRLVTLGCPDRDEDGIADNDDECPDEAGIEKLNGCPAKDSDGDGIGDDVDKCPEIAGTNAAMGCPDRDGDGVADADDKCPDQLGTFANFGCPKEEIATGGIQDQDNDGIVDKDDSCPNLAGPASNRGCPITSSSTPIFSDPVPAPPVTTTVSTSRPSINNNLNQYATSRTLLLDIVYFESASHNLDPEDISKLDEVIAIMQGYPNYELFVFGHTDDKDNSAANLRLSENRAQACYNYITRSVDASRVNYKGFGETEPASENSSEAGRQLNRRVALMVIDRVN